tara:strand:+ start:68 stop:361 length:294 start_codon:yes stop_codon:yes gene_type:complete
MLELFLLNGFELLPKFIYMTWSSLCCCCLALIGSRSELSLFSEDFQARLKFLARWAHTIVMKNVKLKESQRKKYRNTNKAKDFTPTTKQETLNDFLG